MIHTLLSRVRVSSLVLFLIILGVSGSLMVSLAIQESAIMDEVAHIPAGYSYVKYLDFRLNPEHPPLVKALSAVPLLLLDLSFPTDRASWTDLVNGQWDAGREFLYQENGRRADTILFFSRIAPILLTLLLVCCVYLWSRSLMGPWWALIPTVLVGLSPNILAHGHYVTTDMGAALGFFIGLYAIMVSLMRPRSWGTLTMAGILFGIAQLMKFSNVLLIPVFGIILIIFWIARTHEQRMSLFSKDSFLLVWSYVRAALIVGIIGYLVVWGVYSLFISHYPIDRQLSDTQFILSSYGGGEGPGISACSPAHFSERCPAELVIWASSHSPFRGIAQYALGVLMVIQRSAGGNTAYFLEMIDNSGWWYYFPLVFLFKMPIPTLIILGLGLLLALWRFGVGAVHSGRWSRFLSYCSLHPAEVSMIVFVVFYWLYSINSPLNIGFRHVLPTIPFMIILATISIRRWIVEYRGSGVPHSLGDLFSLLRHYSSGALKLSFVGVLLIWFFSQVITTYPYYLSYFNEASGGVMNGYMNVTDSNYDWGQDMKRLRDWVYANNVSAIAVDYFGGGDINYYLDDRGIGWDPWKGNPADSGIEWLAVSINTIQSARATAAPYFQHPLPDAYSFVEDYRNPDVRVGTSLFLYRLR